MCIEVNLIDRVLKAVAKVNLERMQNDIVFSQISTIIILAVDHVLSLQSLKFHDL